MESSNASFILYWYTKKLLWLYYSTSLPAKTDYPFHFLDIVAGIGIVFLNEQIVTTMVITVQ